MDLTISKWEAALNDGAALKKASVEVVGKNGFVSGRVFLESDRQRDAFAENDALKIWVKPVQKPDGILAIYMYCDWWTRPAFCKDFQEIPDRTNVVLIRAGETYTGFLALPGNIFKTRFTVGTDGDTLLAVMSAYRVGPACIKEDSFLAVTDSDPYRCLERLMKEAAARAGIPDREHRKYPKMFEKLGWCSWNAFYRELSEKNLLEKAEEMRKKQIPFGWALLDDGWMETTEGYMLTLAADPVKFPNGLKPVVEKMKEIAGISQVGVWHAFEGYWDGVKEGSEAFSQEKENLIPTVQGRWLPAPDAEKAYRFFSDWHRLLKEEGIDFVKVDSQSTMLGHYQGNVNIGEAARQLHLGLERSVQTYMDNRLINCMCMDTQNLLVRPASPISRNSTDFFPLQENGFEEHLLQNAYNSLYNSILYHGDWDMFWSSHPDAEKHALLRALSGGLIYVSDKVGESDPVVLSRLCYKDGTILRAHQAAVPTRDCLFLNPAESGYLKIKNECNGVYYLAIFSYSDDVLQVCWQLSDVMDIAHEAQKYAVYGFCHQSCEIVDRSELKKCMLEKKGYELYLIAPVIQGSAVFGLRDKYLASHAVESVVRRGDTLEICLKESGDILAYCESCPERVTVNGVAAGMTQLGENGFYVIG
ncbi:MAG: hypothetical protein IJ390_06455 [Lachnospiraceae bacterium]|nr:hypothetical protein [Lachnospiraceae bacterium]